MELAMPQEFPSVANYQEKYDAYKTQMERFTQARDQGFYLEGIITYVAAICSK